MRGKSIAMYLIDGTPDGIVKANLANRTSLTYRIPRTEIQAAMAREDLKQSGVYFLFGRSEITDKPVVYIGKGGHRQDGSGTLGRLSNHIKKYDEDKDIYGEEYWTEAIVLTTLNNSFGPTEISFLENYFYNLAIKNSRYKVRNKDIPNKGHVTEEKESELLEVIEDTILLVGALGHNVFDDESSLRVVQQTEKPVSNKNKGTLYFVSNDIVATSNATSDGFLLHKNSMVAPTLAKSCPDSVINNRKKYKSIIKDNVLQEDILFNSPSGAAAFVAGANRSGKDSWIDGDNNTLRDLEQKQ